MRTKQPAWAWPGSRLQLIFAENTGKADTHITRFLSRLKPPSFSLLEVEVFSLFLSAFPLLSLVRSLSACSSRSCWERTGGGFCRMAMMSTRFFRLEISLAVSLCLFFESLSQADSSKIFVSFLRPIAAAMCRAVSPFWIYLSLEVIRIVLHYYIYDIMYIYRSVAAKRSLIKDCIVRFLKTPVTFQNNRVNSVSRLYVMLTIEIIRF